MKFKIGDSVRTKHMEPGLIGQHGPSGLTYFQSFVDNENRVGKILDVHEKNKTYYVQLENDKIVWWYDETWLEQETVYSMF